MKPWNAWVACLGCAGLCLALVGCGGGSNVPDPASDSHAANGSIPSPEPSAPPAVVQSEPVPAPVAEPAPAPAPAPSPAPEPVAAAGSAPPASTTATEQTKPEDAAARSKTLAMNKPAADATKPPETTATVPAAEVKPNLAATVDADAIEAENPFAVFSDTSSTARTKGSMQPPAGGTSEAATEGAPSDANSSEEGERPEGALGYLHAAGSSDRGRSTGLYRSPDSAATAFLTALKEKNLAKIAEATALRAPIEAVTKNQKLFVAILEQDLAPEDLDELAKKLEGYQLAGANQAKSSAKLGIILTKNKGTSTMSRTLTMRHEKAGWKVLDISGEREFEKPISMPRMGGRRR